MSVNSSLSHAKKVGFFRNSWSSLPDRRAGSLLPLLRVAGFGLHIANREACSFLSMEGHRDV